MFAIGRQAGRETARRTEERALAQAEIGIIGGSGLYSMPGFTKRA